MEAQWCSQGDLLAVAGMERHRSPSDSACASITRNALVKFYNVQGEHIYTLETPAQVSLSRERTLPCRFGEVSLLSSSKKVFSQPLVLQFLPLIKDE